MKFITIFILCVALFIVFLTIRSVYRWIKRIVLLWKNNCRKLAIKHLIKGLIIIGIICLVAFCIKQIMITLIAIFVGSLALSRSGDTIYYY